MRCLLIAAAGDYLGVRIRCEKAAFNMAALLHYFYSSLFYLGFSCLGLIVFAGSLLLPMLTFTMIMTAHHEKVHQGTK